MCSRRAAEEKRRSSATVRKYLSWRRSTRHATAGRKAGPRPVRPGLTGRWFYVTAKSVGRRRSGYEYLVGVFPIHSRDLPAQADYPGACHLQRH